jgi:hypothetical protein
MSRATGSVYGKGSETNQENTSETDRGNASGNNDKDGGIGWMKAMEAFDNEAGEFFMDKIDGCDDKLTMKELIKGLSKLQQIDKDGGFDTALKDGEISKDELEDIFNEYENTDEDNADEAEGGDNEAEGTDDKEYTNEDNADEAGGGDNEAEGTDNKEDNEAKAFFSGIFKNYFGEEVELTDGAVEELEKQYGGEDGKLDDDEKGEATDDLNKRMKKGEFESAVKDGGLDMVTGYDVKDVYEKDSEEE